MSAFESDSARTHDTALPAGAVGDAAPDLERAAATARLSAILRAVQRLATEPVPPSSPFDALVAWGVHEDDARTLAAYPMERLGVYGGLVRGTVLSALKNQLGMACARVPPEHLRALVDAFLAESAPRSPYLRDLPFEFAMWAAERWTAGANVPVCVPDLARYELFLFATGTTERGARPERAEALAADRGVWLEGSVHLARFEHAVHAIPEEEGDLSEPERREVALLAYRDGENDVRKLELTLPAMAILERLYRGAPLGRAIAEAAQALGRPVDAPLIEGISKVLADLSERGALLGPATEGAPLPDRAERSPFHGWLMRG